MNMRHRFDEGFQEKLIFEENTELWFKYKTVNLGCGFPDWQTPSFVQKNLQLATSLPLENNYTQCAGHPELRKILAEKYSNVYGTTLDESKNIVVTNGATSLLFLISFTFLEPNDEVVFFRPFFQPYEINSKMARATRRHVELRPTNNEKWEIDFEELEAKINEKTKILIINSPHNPTGKVFEKWELEKIASVVKRFPNLIVVADEVYEKSVYTNNGFLSRFASLEGMFDRTISVLSAGKTFHTTGWRIGYGIGPSSLIAPLINAQKNAIFCSNRPCQLAVSLCLKDADGYYKEFREKLLKSRDLLIKGLRGLFPSLSIFPPQGSYFFVMDVSSLESYIPKKYEGPLSYRFFKFLAEEIGVSMIPLSSFYGGEEEDFEKEDGRRKDKEEGRRRIKKEEELGEEEEGSRNTKEESSKKMEEEGWNEEKGRRKDEERRKRDELVRVSVCVGEEGVKKAIERMQKIIKN